MEDLNKTAALTGFELIIISMVIAFVAMVAGYVHHITFVDSHRESASKEIEIYAKVYPYDNKTIKGSDIVDLMTGYTTNFDYMIYLRDDSGGFQTSGGVEKYLLINDTYTEHNEYAFSLDYLVGNKKGTTGILEKAIFDNFTSLAVTEKEAKTAREQGLAKLKEEYQSRGLNDQTAELPTTFIFVQGDLWG